MTPPRAKRGGASLFAAAGLERDAPRPLADKLRPTELAEVVGQDHLLGAGRRAHAHARYPLARLAGVLGTARDRQDHGGAAAGAGDRPAFRADLGDLLRRRRPQEGVRRGARAARDRAGHAAVRRRDPSLQPRAAGFLPAGDGRRHHRAGRRHHREPVLRADRAAALARARAGVQAARRRGDREAARPRRGDRRQDAAARCRGARNPSSAWPTATAARRSRWPKRSGARRARARSSTRPNCRRWCSAARRSTTRSRTATTT